MSTTLTLPITGLKCDGCTRSLTRALEAAAEVEKAAVTLEPPQASLTFGPTPLSRNDVITLIRKAGFDSPCPLPEKTL